MTEELISFEIAKLAKEKGFKHNSKCYGGNGEILENIENHTNNIMQRFRYEAPTQSLLQKWLREEHKLYITVTACTFDEEGKYSANLSGYSRNKFLPVLIDGFTVYETYEEALEEGLQEALKLI